MYELPNFADFKKKNTVSAFTEVKQDFDIITSVPIGNEYLRNVWKYAAIEAMSDYLLNTISEVKLDKTDSETLKRRIIQTKLDFIKEMDIERFFKGKYSPFLQEKAPIPDSDKYTPMIFLVRTHYYISTYELPNEFSCNNPFIFSLLPLQNKINLLIKYYEQERLSSPYDVLLKGNIDYIKNISPRIKSFLKDVCHINE